ncbi:MAG: redoxin family protein [Planctomycetaceae bacterium]|nr:redoxin family protein [Planctomycetaceae bacterium]
MRLFQNTVGFTIFLLAPLVSLFATERVRPEVSDPAEINALVTALTDFVKQTPSILGSARLNEAERQALKTAIDHGTLLLEKTPNVEQKYWAAEFLIKARLTLAMVQPPNTATELQKIEEAIAVLEEKPEKVEILPAAKYQVLKHSILLLTKSGDDLPGSYSVKEAVKHYIEENPRALDSLGKMLVDVSVQNVANDRQFTIDTIRDVAELYKKSEFLVDREYSDKLQGMLKRFEMIDSPMTFSGVDLAGNKISSSDFRDKVVLIDFWATWCSPCLAAMPEMKRLHELYSKRGFEIVGVSVDRKKDELAKFLEEKKLPWKILSDTATAEKGGKRLGEYYGITEYPTLMLVGRDGKVIATDLDMKTLEKELAKLFGNGNSNSKREIIPVKIDPVTPSLL